MTTIMRILTLLLTCAVISLQQPPDDFSDIMGPYCINLGCCNNRQDTCSKPVQGTLCYCDEFCSRHDSHDCCPDYWSICLGINITTLPPFTTTPRPQPPEELKLCSYNDRRYRPNQTIIDNCNKCVCTVVGRFAEMLCEENICLVNPDIIKTVNERSVDYGWAATNYSKFWGRTLDDGIRYRLGTLQPQKAVFGMNPMKRMYDPSSLPKQFDTQTRWPRYISPVVDQGWCGSSWAISTAAVASDRYGIVSQGFEEIKLSAQNIISCEFKDKACDGGRYDRAWNFVRKYGLVNEACFPYTGEKSSCTIGRTADLLRTGCATPLYGDRKQRYKVGPAYKLGNESDIMYEMMRSGPVQATMKVYQDFFSYLRGIYTHTDMDLTNKQGYHSVRIVGWGEEYSSTGRFQRYWKVVNSWGTDWGEDGHFRIARGTNECEIESFVLGVWPEVAPELLAKSQPYNI